ncbi:MAG: DUF134 domain-containing protein [Firmicutes bacterium]|nr:DUF134 domain-containing protein [Bacillota bacterium]
MPRPVKWRRVGHLPVESFFAPGGKEKSTLEEVVLKVEELEAMRLKDIEGLNQEQCAERMNISRQTFQLIIDRARGKTARALVEGKAIRIRGGKYTVNICRYSCTDCGNQFDEPFEKEKVSCPRCTSEQVRCTEINGFCKKQCRRENYWR